MKYVGNPVEVDAFKIKDIRQISARGTLELTLDDPEAPADHPHIVLATPEMTSRFIPDVGDYWVIQSDGYVYLNPTAVFERKYSPKLVEAGKPIGLPSNEAPSTPATKGATNG
jgi:hypothetical protein